MRFSLTQLIVHRDGYTKGYDSLHAHISPKILPKEYGGEAGSILDMWGKKTSFFKSDYETSSYCKDKSIPRRHFWLSVNGYSSEALLHIAVSEEWMATCVVGQQNIQEISGLR